MKKVSCVDMSQCLVPVLKPSGIHSFFTENGSKWPEDNRRHIPPVLWRCSVLITGLCVSAHPRKAKGVIPQGVGWATMRAVEWWAHSEWSFNGGGKDARDSARATPPPLIKTSQGSAECERRWRQSRGDHGKMTSPLQTDKRARALHPTASEMPANE